AGNGRLLRVMQGSGAFLEFTRDSRSVLTVGGRWDVYAGKLAREFQNGEPVRANFALSPDGKLQAVGDSEGKLFLRDVASGEIAASVTTSKTYWPMRFTPDGKRLLAYHVGSGLDLLDVASLQPQAQLMPAFDRSDFAEYWDLAVADDAKHAAYVTYH